MGVDLLGEFVAHLGQRLGLGGDCLDVVAFQRLFQLAGALLDVALFTGVEFVAQLGHRLAHAVQHRLALIARVHQLARLAVFVGVLGGVGNHLLDFFIRQTGTRLDDDFVFLAGRFVLCRHMQDAVGVDVERHFDLRHAARGRRDFGEVESAERLVAAGDFALALQDMHRDRVLVVVGGREHLARFGRDGGVLFHQFGHHPAEGFDAERQRSDIQQQHILDIAAEHAALYRRADRDRFIRVDIAARLFAEEVAHHFVHFGHAGLPADQNDVVDVGRVQPGVAQCGLARSERLLQQVVHQRLQFGAGQLHIEVLRSAGVGGDIRQVDLGLRRSRQLDFGFLRALL